MKGVASGRQRRAQRVLVGGRVVGTWTRRQEKERVVVVPAWFERRRPPTPVLRRAVARYAAFLSLEARVRAA